MFKIITLCVSILTLCVGLALLFLKIYVEHEREKFTILHLLYDYLYKQVEYTSLEIFRYRLYRCQTCPHLRWSMPNINCRTCGCFMLAKALYKKSFCDLGEWQADL